MTTQLHHDGGEAVKNVLDAASVGVVIATILQWLPAIAALLTVIWTAIRIWESATVQGIYACLKRRLRAR